MVVDATIIDAQLSSPDELDLDTIESDAPFDEADDS